MTDNTEIRGITQLLAEVAPEGAFLDMIDAEVRNVVTAMAELIARRESGKAKVVITLGFEADSELRGVMALEGKVSGKRPDRLHGRMLYATADGGVHRRDPRQAVMPGLRAVDADGVITESEREAARV